ncbi:hypothetical protein PGTUg99_016781 [Puccinia graminis f. sp. tritici]|uniref:Uncharacterized protein n=1 Tax=Puccinia graminis f. sp. tritici TaxID=56615 RepID=A0A5B0S3I3_PUCGR|nr:hypothetical protein PGTUg99_016781 [Puccinia graminis f. sp. tritici]
MASKSSSTPIRMFGVGSVVALALPVGPSNSQASKSLISPKLAPLLYINLGLPRGSGRLVIKNWLLGQCSRSSSLGILLPLIEKSNGTYIVNGQKKKLETN